MMTNELFESLLADWEGETVDFKEEMYSLASTISEEKEKAKADFIHDILAMNNTPRNGSAYILLGVEDRKRTIVGINATDTNKIYDAKKLQDRIDADISPNFTIKFEFFKYKGMTIGVIEIPLSVYLSTYSTANKDIKVKKINNGNGITEEKVAVSEGLVYYRSGSRNKIADATKQSEINKWFQNRTTQQEDKKFSWFDTAIIGTCICLIFLGAHYILQNFSSTTLTG